VRVVGYWFGPGEGPAETGWLPIGDICVIAGANDSGKSRLLRRLEVDLNAMEAISAGAPTSTSLTFLELDSGEFDELLGTTYSRAGAPNEARRAILELLGEADSSAVAPKEGQRPESGPSAADWLNVFAGENSAVRGFTEVRTLLEASRVVAVGPYPGSVPPKLGLTWCIPSLHQLGDRRAAVEAFLADRLVPRGLDSHAPTPILFVGTFDGPLVPAPRRLPMNDTSLREEIVLTVSQWLEARRALAALVDDREFADTIAEGGILYLLENLASPRRLWLDSPDVHSARLGSDVVAALSAITDRAQDARVPFLKARYRLSVESLPLTEWADELPVVVRLRPETSEPRSSSLGDETSAFLLSEAADGLQWWAQLAVLEGVDALRESTAHVLNTLPWAAEEGHERVQDWIEYLDATGELHPEVGRHPLNLEEKLAFWGLESMNPEPNDPNTMRCFRPTLYLLDEPERHLNPRLVRNAATWLPKFFQQRRSQAVLVTHSAGFLGMTDATFVHVERVEGRASLEAFDPAELTAFTWIAWNLGLDHGELLAHTSSLVFVEGEADRAVLEALYGPRLHRAGVVVIPLGGVKNHPVVIESRVLLRYCAAHRVAVVFDALDEACIATLIADPDARRRARGNKNRPECQNMATLLDHAHEQGKEVTPLALPVPDMFDLLDERILKERYGFPGHVEARRAFEHERREEQRYHHYVKEKFEFDPKSLEIFQSVAGEMRRRDCFPRPLESLVSQIETLCSQSDLAV